MALNAGLYNVLFGLRAGAELVIMDRFDPEEFAALVVRFGIRSTVLPPAAMVMLTDSAVSDLGAAAVRPVDHRAVVGAAGAALRGEVPRLRAERVRPGRDRRGHRLDRGRRADPSREGGCGRDARTRASTSRIDDDGHLLVRPPNTAVGVEDRLDADGFLDTGDLARIDDDGFVWIEGRVSDVINRGGNKVFPDAVEEVLRLSPSVDDVAVVGVPDDRAWARSRWRSSWGGRSTTTQLVALCREHLIAYKVPIAFHWVDALPRTEVGKVLRAELLRDR